MNHEPMRCLRPDCRFSPLPGRDVGQRIGQAISDNISINIPDGVTAGGRRARASATREGGAVGGAFGRAVSRKLEEAFRSLPKANVRLGDTGLNADLDRLRARLQTLSGKTIGIDIDAGAALAEITDIDARLQRLAAEHPTVQVSADTAAARAALAEVQRAINGVDHDDVNVRVHADTAGAIASLRALGIALGTVAALPVIPVAAAGIGAIASAAVAAGAGVGALALVAIPAIKSVTSVMQAKTAADKESARASDNSASTNVRAAQTALQMAGAQAQLSSAHRQAAQAVAQANRAVTDAERSLTDAKRSARQAEEDLTQARKDATQQLRDLNDRLLDGKLDEREATLRVQEAQAELNKVLADPTSTDLQKERARLSYDEAVRGARKAKESNAELQKQVIEANKKGVDGTNEVKRAKERLADADRKITDQERTVADARRKVREAQVQGAEQVASAERSLQAAQLSSVDTSAKSVTAADTYRQALANLTPAQRDLYDAIAGPKGLKAAFADWSTSLQPDVLPLFTQTVTGAKNALPGLTPLVKTAADAVGILFDKASKELKSPFWQGFKDDVEKSAKPAIVGLGVSFGNVIKGMAGVVDAFLPHMDSISDKMQTATGKFADWGTKLKGSPEFEEFLDYADEHGPLVAETVGSIASAFLSIGSALAPISKPLLKLIGGMAEGIGVVAENAPWFILLIYGIITATKLWTLAQVAFNLVMTANPLVLVGLAVLALVGFVIYAYNQFDWFREAVQDVWSAIETAASAVVDWFAGPFTDFFTKDIPAIFQSVLDWVTDNWPWILGALTGPIGLAVVAIIEYWDEITDGLGDAWSWIKKQVLNPMRDFFVKTIPGWGDTLADKLTGAFDAATNGIKGAWQDVAGIVASPVNFIIKWVYTHGIKAVWDKVAGFVGLGKLPDAPKLLDTDPKFATGGQVFGGTPGKDSVRAWLMPGEYVVRRDSAQKIGYANLARMNEHGEIPRFAKGGLVGGIWDWTKNVGDWTTLGLELMGNPGAAWDKLIKPTMSRVKGGVGDSPMGNVLTGVSKKMSSSLRDMLINAATLGFGGGGGGVGQWIKPVNVPYGTRFGVAGPMWSSGHHTGLDFPASVGTPVHAVDGGTVIGVGTAGPYGNHIEIDHGGRLVSLYAHLSKILAGLGQVVGQGDVIGQVGATGNVTGPHLHLEARVNGRAVDPMPYLESIRTGGKVSQGIAAAKNFAKSQLKYFGWGMGEWPSLDRLWTGESGWRWNAENPSSGAYGIPQALPGSKMASAGPDWRTNAATQIQWGMGYIKNRPDYGSPSAAYGKWLSRMPHWYDDGGYLPPGLSLVANGTGSPEAVFTATQWDDIRAARGAGRPITINVESTTVLDGQELKGMVDKRIEFHDGEAARQLNNGRIVI